MTDYLRAVEFLRVRGITIGPELLREAFEHPPAPDDRHLDPLTYAELDWRAHVGEHDRAPGSGLSTIFKLAGWGSVPQGDAKVPEWCGMAVVSWLLRAGLNPAFNTSFLHTLNVEAFFTYGARSNVNPKRLDTEVALPGPTDAWTKIEAWHSQQAKPREWVGFMPPIMAFKDLDAETFLPGDVMLIDWSGKRTEADHIALVRSWDGKVLHTFEGNRTGLGPGGEKWHDAVVTCSYDLTDPKTLALIYGVGRCSPLDFGTEQVR